MSFHLLQSVTDDRIEAAIAAAGVIPEMCEWYGDPDRRIVFRVEAHMGKFGERALTPYMDDEALTYYVGQAAAELSRDA